MQLRASKTENKKASRKTMGRDAKPSHWIQTSAQQSGTTVQPIKTRVHIRNHSPGFRRNRGRMRPNQAPDETSTRSDGGKGRSAGRVGAFTGGGARGEGRGRRGRSGSFGDAMGGFPISFIYIVFRTEVTSPAATSVTNAWNLLFKVLTKRKIFTILYTF